MDGIDSNEEATRNRFIVSVVQRARQIAKSLEGKAWDESALTSVEREIAIVLNQIENIQRLHWGFIRELDEAASNLRFDRTQLQEKYNSSHLDLIAMAEGIDAKLWGIARDRRDLILVEEMKVRPLLDRLLMLLNRHRQASGS